MMLLVSCALICWGIQNDRRHHRKTGRPDSRSRRRARIRAKIDDLTFHDSRHDAITRLAQKLSVLQLARVVGHRDVRSLMTYYNETAESMARLL